MGERVRISFFLALSQLCLCEEKKNSFIHKARCLIKKIALCKKKAYEAPCKRTYVYERVVARCTKKLPVHTTQLIILPIFISRNTRVELDAERTNANRAS